MDKNKSHNNLSDNDPIRWKSLGFSETNDYLFFIFKKTEKIVSALYLVSGLLKDEDPMKWEMRNRGIEMLSASFNASSVLGGDKNILIQSLFTASMEVVSLLNVSKIAGLISHMNHEVLEKEIVTVLDMLRDRLSKNAESAGYVLSESFFKTPGTFSTTSPYDGYSQVPPGSSPLKGHKNLENDKYPFSKTPSKGQSSSVEKKNKRQNEILNLLKNRSDLSVKDFMEVIKDCSEKTVQRELLELVDKGVIKKQGERRWSRYSLN